MCIICRLTYWYISQAGGRAGIHGDSMAERAGQAAQANGLDALLSAREQQLLDAAAVREMLLAKLDELPPDVKPKHASDFYRVVRAKEQSQQTKSECLACGHSFATTGSTRLVKHLLLCALVPNEVKKPFKLQQEKSESDNWWGSGSMKSLSRRSRSTWPLCTQRSKRSSCSRVCARV